MKANVKWPAASAACLITVSILNAQPVDQQAHIKILTDQAKQASEDLGEKVDQLSGGGMNFIQFGTVGQQLINALSTNAGRAVSNPRESEDFISRLAGNVQSEESVAWCGANALVGFNDSGSFVKT